MKKYLFLILFLLVILDTAFCQERQLYVELLAKKTTLERGEIFTVLASIMNVDMKPQKICFWVCSYASNWQLKDSSPSIGFYGQECTDDFVRCKVLEPFEKFEKEVYLQVSDNAKRGVASFKLGFMPCLNKEECFEGSQGNQNIFSGQEITVVIK